MQVRFYVGVDWGNDRHALCVTDSDGKLVKEQFVKNDETALKVLAHIVAGAPAASCYVAAETMRLALVEAMIARGYAVFTINPRQLKTFRDRYGVSGAKDDRRDARAAASSLRTDPECYRRVQPETGVHRRLRVALRGLEASDDAFRRAANQLREIILVVMPGLLDLCKGADERWFWELVPKALTSDALSGEEIGEILRKRRIRRLCVSDVQKVLQRSHLFTSSEARSSAAWSVSVSVGQLEALLEQQALYENELEAALKVFPKPQDRQYSDAELIRSVPGFGIKSTASLLVEASDCVAARDYRRIRALAGVAAVTSTTGKRQQERRHLVMMRRACSKRLRQTMHCVANVARQHDVRCERVFLAAKNNGKGHARALRSVADRVLSYAMGVLRTGEPYRVDFASVSSSPSPSTSPPKT